MRDREEGKEEMNVRDEGRNKRELERGTEAGSDEETDEDSEPDDAAPPRPHGMFCSLFISDSSNIPFHSVK